MCADLIERWVDSLSSELRPSRVTWVDGGREQIQELLRVALDENFFGERKTLYELRQSYFPDAFLHRSHPDDVARTENRTFIVHNNPKVVGPNNNWMSPDQARSALEPILRGAMKNRTMYVIPFVMGHPDSVFAQPCVQITDSVYVAISMCIMTRVGEDAIRLIRGNGGFIKGIHTLGELDKQKKYIVHFPEEDTVISVNSGYGGNALLGKKCISLRLASYKGWNDRWWLAEHMLIIEVETPEGEKFYFTAAFPSASGKTNLALIESALPGWKVRTLGDDIAWLYISDDGRLYAMNPEAGFFGVAPGTSSKTNPNMMRTLRNSGSDFPTLFTNTALDPENQIPWWEGLDPDIPLPKTLIDWMGNIWSPDTGKPAAHPNSRFTVSIRRCPILSPEYDNPRGVPISGIIFGGRRSDTIPLVFETFDWEHGVFTAASMGAETTAAAEGEIGRVRRDPFSMLPFLGYNMAFYFRYWLDIGKRLKHRPKIFFVNWFRKDGGRFIWPGFGENMRVIKWMVERINGKAKGVETEVGILPDPSELDIGGLELSKKEILKLLSVDKKEWEKEIKEIESFFSLFGDDLPGEFSRQIINLKKRFGIKV